MTLECRPEILVSKYATYEFLLKKSFLPVDAPAQVADPISQCHTTLRSKNLFPSLYCPWKVSGLQSAIQAVSKIVLHFGTKGVLNIRVNNEFKISITMYGISQY